ncbi:MAG: hypothetical protein ACJAS3_002222 [Roseivirga sp.]|jgi:hypothetical protein
MKRRISIFSIVVATICLSINVSYGKYGTETYKKTVVKVECSIEGSGSASGNVNPGGGGGSISGAGSVVYAHYPGKIKTCPGWARGCWDAGEEAEITSFTPIISCPNRQL